MWDIDFFLYFRSQQTAIWELVETEVAYIRTLKVIQDVSSITSTCKLYNCNRVWGVRHTCALHWHEAKFLAAARGIGAFSV